MVRKRKSRGLRGLRGTPAEHRTMADRYAGFTDAQIDNARKKRSCASALLALEYGAAAAMEESWVTNPHYSRGAGHEALKRARKTVETLCPCAVKLR